MVERKPKNIKPTKKRHVNLIESFAHCTILEKVRDEVKLHIDTILNGNLTTNVDKNTDSDPLHDWARDIAAFVKDIDCSTSMAHFTTLRTHLSKYDLVEYYTWCLGQTKVTDINVAKAVQQYKDRRLTITGKGGLGGGTGNEDDTIVKQIAATCSPTSRLRTTSRRLAGRTSQRRPIEHSTTSSPLRGLLQRLDSTSALVFTCSSMKAQLGCKFRHIRRSY